MTQLATQSDNLGSGKAMLPKNRKVTAQERTRILAMLPVVPLPELRVRTGRSFITLARIAAEACA